jgi:hypothetical protein
VIVVGWEWITSIIRHHAAAKDRMKRAATFAEWSAAARELDTLEGRQAWKETIDNNIEQGFDHLLIGDLLRDMRSRRANNDLHGLILLTRFHVMISWHEMTPQYAYA